MGRRRGRYTWRVRATWAAIIGRVLAGALLLTVRLYKGEPISGVVTGRVYDPGRVEEQYQEEKAWDGSTTLVPIKVRHPERYYLWVLDDVNKSHKVAVSEKEWDNYNIGQRYER